jgi:UDP-N-acetylmuramoylalanine--D-glutamate ligase
MDLKGKKALVVGLGRTGEAVCRFLKKQEARIKISEKKSLRDLGQRADYWREQGIPMEAGGHTAASFLEADLIVPSPGVPDLPEFDHARKKGVEVISEIELAFRFLKGKIVGITGTNGKSTTATLSHKILKEAGLKSHLAGNIGIPLIQFVENSQPQDIYVTELSSFQLSLIRQFRASVSVFLNISPDHLDWHSGFDDYYTAKKNLLLTQKKNDTAILNRDDPRVWSLRRIGKFRLFAFSQEHSVSPGCCIKDSRLVITNDVLETLLDISEIPLCGTHNRENIMASALVGHVFGIPASSIRMSIVGFKGLEHRMEKVLSLGDVVFYNDSKATNVDAALKSIQSFHQPLILILGGRDKGGDFTLLREHVKKRVKTIILVGEAKEKISKALNKTVPVLTASDLGEAVRIGYQKALPKGIVLLAPGCTSFDMFQDFEERGRVFKKEVLTLKKRMESEKS